MKLKLITLIGVALCVIGCAKAPPPPPPQNLMHTVKYAGETLGTIAKWYTGDVNHWRTIVAANPGLKPERVRIGMTIQIPYALVKETRPLPAKQVPKLTSGSSTTEVSTPDAKPDSKPVASKPVAVSTPLPTPAPTASATVSPTAAPTVAATKAPTTGPTTEPTLSPTEAPTVIPTPVGKSREDLLKDLLAE